MASLKGIFANKKKVAAAAAEAKANMTPLEKLKESAPYGYICEPLPESAQVIEKYWVREPFAGIAIAKMPEQGGSLEYFVQEVTLTPSEQRLLDKVISFVSVEINPMAIGKEEDVRKAVLKEAKRILDKYSGRFPMLRNPERRDKIYYYIERDLLGYGPIHSIMADWRIEDISCDGVMAPLYVWHRRYESIPTNIKFVDKELLDDFIVKLAHKSGKHVSSAFPIVDAMIFGKHRLAASFREEVSPKGSTFTIRKFREEPYSVIDLMNLGTVNDEISAYFWLMMENRASMLIIGGTAAGKTTLLNAIAGLIKPGYKVVTVEETAEINIPTENWVQFTSRESYGMTGSKIGEVSLFDLVKTSLRYRPDFLVVGEVRGEEAFVLFQAVASVTGDTPILVREHGEVGLMAIGDLANRYYREGEERTAKFVEDVEVLSLDSEKRVTFRPVQYVLRHKTDEVYNLRYTGGALRATGNHSVFVMSGDASIVQKPLRDILPGELLVSFCGSQIERSTLALDSLKLLAGTGKRLVVSATADGRSLVSFPRSSGVPSSFAVDDDMGFTLGAYLADGCVKNGRSGDNRTVFCFGEPEKHLFAEKVSDFFGKWGGRASVDDRGTYTLYEFSHSPASRIFENICGRTLRTKRVPSSIFTAPKSTVKSFLDGFKADSRRTQTSHRNFTVYTSAKPEIVNGISWLARLNGLTSFISERGSKYRSMYVWDSDHEPMQWVPVAPLRLLRERLDPASMPLSLTYVFNRKQGVVSKKVAHRVMKWILDKARNPVDPDTQRIVRNVQAMLESTLMVSKVHYVEKEEYDDYVYDVSVPGSEAFFGGETPVLLHNTGHGGLCTIHGESFDSAVKRLTSPPMNVAESYIPLMNVAVMLERVMLPKTVAGVPFGRRITTVWEVEDFNKYVPVFEWSPTEDLYYNYTKRSVMLHRFAYRTGRTFGDMLEEIQKRRALLRWMQGNNVRNVKEVYKYVTEYYVDSKGLFRRLNIEVEPIKEVPTVEGGGTTTAAEAGTPKVGDVNAPAAPSVTVAPPLRFLESGSFKILKGLSDANDPVDRDALLQSSGLDANEFEKILGILTKIGHATVEQKSDKGGMKTMVAITPQGRKAYAQLSKKSSQF